MAKRIRFFLGGRTDPLMQKKKKARSSEELTHSSVWREGNVPLSLPGGKKKRKRREKSAAILFAKYSFSR